MHRTRELKTSLEHCRAWKRHLESQLSEFAGVGDNRNQQEHQLKALQTDLENAQNNISSLQRQLDDLMDEPASLSAPSRCCMMTRGHHQAGAITMGSSPGARPSSVPRSERRVTVRG